MPRRKTLANLEVFGHRIEVRRHAWKKGRFEARFIDALPSGPDGFTISLLFDQKRPLAHHEIERILDHVRSTAEGLIHEFEDKDCGN